jgi:cystathionine beta-lyase/cystathionine gamma-synthase
MKRSIHTEVVHQNKKDTESIRSKATPIFQTSVFQFKTLEDLEGQYEGDGSYLYTRNGNPNTDELGQAIAKLEGAEDGVATSSGISAILAGILAVVKNGDHILAAEDLYGGTYHLLGHELKNFGIQVTFADFTELESLQSHVHSNTKLIYSESITNPFLRVEKIAELVNFAKKNELMTMIDNTFATPILLNPIELGVDLVAHSATKYIGGHSDVSAGVLVGRKELVDKARQKVVGLGSNLSPFEAWLTMRGSKTMALRVEKQAANAKELANALVESELVEKVYYPQNELPKGNGAIVTVTLQQKVNMSVFFSALDWIKIVPSLAGVETTVSYPIATSHRALPKEAKEKLGITQHVVRISVGIEELFDIVQQFTKAIEQAAGKSV